MVEWNVVRAVDYSKIISGAKIWQFEAGQASDSDMIVRSDSDIVGKMKHHIGR